MWKIFLFLRASSTINDCHSQNIIYSKFTIFCCWIYVITFIHIIDISVPMGRCWKTKYHIKRSSWRIGSKKPPSTLASPTSTNLNFQLWYDDVFTWWMYSVLNNTFPVTVFWTQGCSNDGYLWGSCLDCSVIQPALLFSEYCVNNRGHMGQWYLEANILTLYW